MGTGTIKSQRQLTKKKNPRQTCRGFPLVTDLCSEKHGGQKGRRATLSRLLYLLLLGFAAISNQLSSQHTTDKTARYKDIV